MATTASGFWNSHETEPKRKYRWILYVGDDNAIPYWTVKKVDKPSYTITTAEHAFINHKFYFPGRVEYNEVSFTIVDSGHPDAAETLRQIIFASGYRLPKSELSSTQSITKQAAVNALGTIKLHQITGGGVGGAGADVPNSAVRPNQNSGYVREAWTLHNAFITSVEFGDLDYTSDDLNEITIKVRYDYAELNDPNGGALLDPVEPSQDLPYAVKTGQTPPRQD